MNMEKEDQEEWDAAEAIMCILWEEWTDELVSGGKETPEEASAIELFAQATGATTTSPLAFMFRGFRAGVCKGLEFADRREKASIE